MWHPCGKKNKKGKLQNPLNWQTYGFYTTRNTFLQQNTLIFHKTIVLYDRQVIIEVTEVMAHYLYKGHSMYRPAYMQCTFFLQHCRYDKSFGNKFWAKMKAMKEIDDGIQIVDFLINLYIIYAPDMVFLYSGFNFRLFSFKNSQILTLTFL